MKKWLLLGLGLKMCEMEHCVEPNKNTVIGVRSSPYDTGANLERFLLAEVMRSQSLGITTTVSQMCFKL